MSAATHLRVRVSEGMTTKVDLTFRAAVAEHLEDLMPDDLAPQLAERGIDVSAVGRSVVAGGFAPQELFQLEENEKTVRVWLE